MQKENKNIELFTIKQTAKRLQCCAETIRRQIRKGTFPFRIYYFSKKMIRVDLSEPVEVKTDPVKLTVAKKSKVEPISTEFISMKRKVLQYIDLPPKEIAKRTGLTIKQIYNCKDRLRKNRIRNKQKKDT